MIFAIIMANNSNKKNFWHSFTKTFRLVIMTTDSFEEKFSTKVSFLKTVMFICSFLFVALLFSFLLLSYSPLNEYVPEKTNSRLQEQLISLSLKTDSLNTLIVSREAYLKNLTGIITGSPMKSNEKINSTEKNNLQSHPISLKKSKEDSLLRVYVESEENSSIYTNKNMKNNFLTFFTPISGLIIDSFCLKTKHFGVDLVAKKGAKISSVLDGTVISSQWTAETGYVLMVQHENNYISVYKHNSVLLKDVGDFVLAGDYIAVVGNSGELSSGPHLHFELWNNGLPLNPTNFINF